LVKIGNRFFSLLVPILNHLVIDLPLIIEKLGNVQKLNSSAESFELEKRLPAREEEMSIRRRIAVLTAELERMRKLLIDTF
jgi:hypothetical protein